MKYYTNEEVCKKLEVSIFKNLKKISNILSDRLSKNFLK